MNTNHFILKQFVLRSLVESWETKTLNELFLCQDVKYKNLTIGKISLFYISGDDKFVFVHTKNYIKLFVDVINENIKVVFQTNGVSKVFVENYNISNLIDNMKDSI